MEQGDLSSQIKILGTAEQTQKVPISPTEDLPIKMFPNIGSVTRVERTLPPESNVATLGERDEAQEPVFVDSQIVKGMTDYYRTNPMLEMGGVLAGYHSVDNHGRRFTQITRFIPLGYDRAAAFTFNADRWSTALKDIEEKGQGEQVVGWTHSHNLRFAPFASGDDKFIMRNFFNEPEQISLTLGTVANNPQLEDLNVYALYRLEGDKAVLQKGLNITGNDAVEARNNHRYYTASVQPETGESKIVIHGEDIAESWFRRNAKDIIGMAAAKAGIKLSPQTTSLIEKALAVVPDFLLDEIGEIIVGGKNDGAIQKKLEASTKILEQSDNAQDELIKLIAEDIPVLQPEALKVTPEDVENAAKQAPPVPEPQIKIKAEDVDSLIKRGEETRQAFQDLERMDRDRRSRQG